MTIRSKKGRTKAATPQPESGETEAKAKANGKPKKSKAKKKPKLDVKKLVEDKLVELMAGRREHSSSVLEWDEAHARAAELKKTMERKQAFINQIIADIDNIRSGNYTPPLPFGENPVESPKGDTPSTLHADGPWKTVELSTLINGSLLEALHEADLKTMGDLHNYTATNKRLSDIKRIGPGKAAKIEDAILKFWQDNPQFAEPNASAESESSDDVVDAEFDLVEAE